MDQGMQFEKTMRLLFGEKANQIAGVETNVTHRHKWLGKALREMLRMIDSLDTTLRHKQMLLREVEAVSNSLKGLREPSWDVVYRLFRLCIRLFGFDYMVGVRCHTLTYWQVSDQRHTVCLMEGGDPMRAAAEEKDAISIRQEVVKDLNRKGVDDFKISLVLNVSEHAVKQLRRSVMTRRTLRKEMRT